MQRHQRLHWQTALALLVMGLFGARAGADVSINTDSLTINGSSTTFNGFAMIAENHNGSARFIVYGDLLINSGTVTITGSRPVELIATNNATIGSGVIFNVSASGGIGKAGGGNGAERPWAYNGGAQTGAGSGGAAGSHGGGGAEAGGFRGSNGGNGGQGGAITGNDGPAGNIGKNGNAGYNISAVGIGGAAGTIGRGGTAGTPGTIGYGGFGAYKNGSNDADPGTGGHAGGNGGNGNPGGTGGTARGGLNTDIGAILTGGSGGGSGGAGGAGGSGGSGAGGSGGGGGGGGAGVWVLDWVDGEDGGIGGGGGAGGVGGGGGIGGSGGAGGAGGGAVAIYAYGRLTIAGQMMAKGGNGAAGQTGTTGSNGLAGAGGGDGGKGGGGEGPGGDPGLGGPAGWPGFSGGDAGDLVSGGGGGGGGGGGRGGNGARGGDGGFGGGGAGGTILLGGSVVIGTGGSIDTTGGIGKPGDGNSWGQNGRLILFKNNAGNFSGNTTGTRNTVMSGLGRNNPFVQNTSGPFTPFVPNVARGAQIAGVTALTPSAFSSIVANAPAGALLAVHRVHIGPSGYDTDFSGYDYLFVINLTTGALLDPRVGIGTAGYTNPLLINTQEYRPFDGTQPLGALDTGNSVYATLVPTAITSSANVQCEVNGRLFAASASTLANGQTLYLTQNNRINRAPVATLAGSAMQFDGVNDFVSVPHRSELNAFPLSVAFWVKTAPGSPDAGLVNKYVSGSYSGYQVFVQGGRVHAWYFRNAANYIWDGDQGLDGGVIADDTWHHVTFTVDNTGGKLYVDGVLKQGRGWTGPAGPTTTTQPVSLGFYPGLYYFAGQLDNVQIWNRVLSAGEISMNQKVAFEGKEGGLLAYWPLDEGFGAITEDMTGQGNNGTIMNGARWLASTAPVNTVNVLYGVSRNITLKGYDQDVDPLLFGVTGNPAHGSLSGNAPHLTYTPEADFLGGDSFLYRVADGVVQSSDATVTLQFGYTPRTLNCGVALEECVNPAQPLTFEFRPSDGSPSFQRTATPNATGNYTLTYLPDKAYTLWIKGSKWLAVSGLIDLRAGDAHILTTLSAGDANNDNSIDVFDLGLLIQAFNSVAGDPIWNDGCDFNCDGSADVFDFDLLVRNFNEVGAP